MSSTCSKIDITYSITTLKFAELIGWGSDQHEQSRQMINVEVLKRQRCLFYYEIFGGVYNTQACVSPVSRLSHINQV